LGTVTFTNASTNATSYLWSYGDGITSTTTTTTAHTHVYQWPGTYTAVLTASNPASVATATATIVATGSVVTKYYYFGSQRVAMRKGAEVYYLHGDHLGSTSLTTDKDGGSVAQARYLPYGQERWISGTLTTDFTFTGQRSERGFGLSDYNARYYDPYLNRWISPDSIVPRPGDPQSLNRFSYVLNNPVRHQDPSGHCIPEYNCPGEKPTDDVDLGISYAWNREKYEHERRLEAISQAISDVIPQPIKDAWPGIAKFLGPPFVPMPKGFKIGIIFVAPGEVAGINEAVAGEGAAATGVGLGAGSASTTNVFSRITATQPLIPNTQIPKSFMLSSSSGGEFWVAPNATKHMAEILGRGPASETAMSEQLLLESFDEAVSMAETQGIMYEDLMYEGNWELIFSQPREAGLLPVIKHALYRP
jgi:RHS repeat-associated protein